MTTMTRALAGCAIFCSLSPANISAAEAAVHSPVAHPGSAKLEGMPYSRARKVILRFGWVPVTGACSGVDERTCRYYPEIGNCSGSGAGYCNMAFTRKGGCLTVVSVGGFPQPGARAGATVRMPCSNRARLAIEDRSVTAGSRRTRFADLAGEPEGIRSVGDLYVGYDDSCNNPQIGIPVTVHSFPR
jgi:hypothetical protein